MLARRLTSMAIDGGKFHFILFDFLLKKSDNLFNEGFARSDIFFKSQMGMIF